MSDQIVGQLLQKIEDTNTQLHYSHKEIQKLKRQNISLKARNQQLIKRVAILQQSQPGKLNIANMMLQKKNQEENEQALAWPFQRKMSLQDSLPPHQNQGSLNQQFQDTENSNIPMYQSQHRYDIESIPSINGPQSSPNRRNQYLFQKEQQEQEKKQQEHKYEQQQFPQPKSQDMVQFHRVDNDQSKVNIVIKFVQKRSCWQEVMIVGEFNKWKPVQMQWCQKESHFQAKFMVERGYKYRFSFRVNGEFMIDSKINSSKNAIGTLTNYVYVPKFGSSGNSSNKQISSELSLSKLQSYVHPDNKDNLCFKKLFQDHKQQKIATLLSKKIKKELDEVKNQSIDAEDGSDQSSDFQNDKSEPKVSQKYDYDAGEKLVDEDLEFKQAIDKKDLNKAFMSAQIVRQKSRLNYQGLQQAKKNKKQKEEDTGKETQLHQLQFFQQMFRAQLSAMERKILSLMQGRWAFSLEEIPKMHVVQGYRIYSKLVPTVVSKQSNNLGGDLVLKKIYDQHGIKISDSHPKLKFFKDMEFFSQFYFMSQQQKKAHIDSTIEQQTTLQIKYKIQGSTPQNLQCMPVEIYPPHIPLHQYNINFNNHTRKITQIVSQLDGPVNFKAIEIDSECGFISNSVMDIYTTHFAEDILNVFHIHINDMSDNVPIQVVTLQQEDKVEDFFQFGVDATGTLLRYKILVKNMEIFRILYNTGNSVEELNFKQIKIEPGKMTGVRDLPLVIKIERLPVGMLACADKAKMQKLIINPNDSKARYSNLSECRMRYPEGLKGDIDVSILSQDGMSLVNKQSFVSICVCQVTEKLQDMQLALMQSLFELKKENEKSALSKVIEGLQTAIKKYHQSKSKKNKSLEEIQEIYQMLTEGEAELNGLLGDVDLTGKQEEEVSNANYHFNSCNQKRLKQLDKIASDSLRRVAAELRMLKLRKQSHDQ